MCGTVFKLAPAGKETVLWSFHGAKQRCPDRFILDATGNLYGTWGARACPERSRGGSRAQYFELI
jgi:hypothetical protein